MNRRIPTVPLERRFHDKYVMGTENECWEWTGAKTPDGYGILTTGSNYDDSRRLVKAHRVAWELSNGPIPQGDGYHGTCVCHHCDNPTCVNPSHLFLGTHKDNLDDMRSKGRGRWDRGEQHHKAKLTEEQVSEIRSLGGKMLQREIADIYGIDQTQVSRILRGASWSADTQ